MQQGGPETQGERHWVGVHSVLAMVPVLMHVTVAVLKVAVLVGV